MTSLYEIGAEMEAIYSALQENGGELTEDLAAALDAIGEAFEIKVERTGLVVRQLGAQAEVVKAEAKRLNERAAGLEKAAANLKEYLRYHMVMAGRDAVKGPLLTVRVQSSPPSAVLHGTLDDLPPEFVRVVPESRVFDAKAAIAAHKAGVHLPECIAVHQSTHVRLS